MSDQICSQLFGKVLFDGTLHPSMECVCRTAIAKGATVSLTTLRKRIKNGASTWDELLAPAKRKSGGKKGQNDKKHDEMHAICMELDARKKAIGYDPR